MKTLGQLISAPILGAAFCVFLPFIGFVLLIEAAYQYSVAATRQRRGR